MNTLINFGVFILFVSSVSCWLNVSLLSGCKEYYPPSPRSYNKFIDFKDLKGGHPSGYLNAIRFFALANEDFHVALTKTMNKADRLYEFVFGTYKNTRSTFRDRTGEIFDTLVNVESPQILKPLEFISFTITMKPDGLIEVFKEKETNSFIQYTVRDITELKYMAFSSHNNQPVKVLYDCESDSCRTTCCKHEPINLE